MFSLKGRFPERGKVLIPKFKLSTKHHIQFRSKSAKNQTMDFEHSTSFCWLGEAVSVPSGRL